MRIPSLAILTVFLVCLGHAHAQSFDTFYVVNRYNVLSDEWNPDKRRSGHLPTEVYFPDNQKVSLFAKQQWKKTDRSNPARLRYTQFHCLRVIKPKDSLLIMRIVAGDSIFKVYKKYAITVDTTFFITEVPFNRNVFNVFYPKSGFLKSRKKIIITNDPYQMSYIPPKNKKLRKSYLNRMLKRIQYEYHAATGQLVQLYPSP